MRGPYPGLGAALNAFGLSNGALIAYEIEKMQWSEGADKNPWKLVDQLFSNPSMFPDEIAQEIGKLFQSKWTALPEKRKRLLKLLSRFELSPEQAVRYYIHEDKSREKLPQDLSDDAILDNPYILYELDRIFPDPILLPVIDRGIFPDDVVRKQYPLEVNIPIVESIDPRRIRANIIQQLEKAALDGDTLLSRAKIIQEIRDLDVQPSCPLDSDLLTIIEDEFKPEIEFVELGKGQPAYQLIRLSKIGQVIRSSVTRRVNGKRHVADVNWRAKLDDYFGECSVDDDQELRAREEKAAALKELFSSRFSVLIGSAGTGKTTLLDLLCQNPQVKDRGVLMLAPTGKARVRMEIQTESKGAQTIAQFLLPLDRYDPETGAYRLSDRGGESGAKTVIIDEASMLTEEQLAAVLDALKGVERLILVGDPRQLPPIGAGRPFLDIVRQHEPENIDLIFPRTGKGYAELTVRRRQTDQYGDDLLLADWFSGRSPDPGADEIWDRIHSDNLSNRLRFVQWETDYELEEKLLNTLVEELSLADRNDEIGFELSLGGTEYGNSVYFWAGKEPGIPGACSQSEDWQILSPVRSALHGTEAINRLLQITFRKKTKEYATNQWRKIPKPMGREEILYGDKVINVQNKRRYDIWPKDDNALAYVANGEIGIAVGQFKTKNFKKLPWKLEVEFSSQPGYKYGYRGADFGEEAQPLLELAYALTIHKAQGSEFKLTFVVLPNPCRLLSRELLYTALTRQRNRVVVFHQGDRHQIKRYAEAHYSEAARRLTNLFDAPMPVELEGKFLEMDLIHKTLRGDSVRSKSEVIIANMLYEKGIDYEYELQFVGKDGGIRYPDFTIEDAETGLNVYWEHLGLLSNPVYRKRWEKKLAWYQEQGVLPLSDGGGPEGTLVITRDTPKGGIDSTEIEKIMNELFG